MLYKKTLTSNFGAYFNLQNEMSNNKINPEVFKELHRKGGAKCKKKKVFRSAPGSFMVSCCGTGWGRERGRNWGEGIPLST